MKHGKYPVKEYIFGNVTIAITRPVLSESERSKREGVILNALQQYGKETYKKAAS